MKKSQLNIIKYCLHPELLGWRWRINFNPKVLLVKYRMQINTNCVKCNVERNYKWYISIRQRINESYCDRNMIHEFKKHQERIELAATATNKQLHQINVVKSEDELMLWYYRLGHLNVKAMGEIVKKNIVHGLTNKTPLPKACDVCYKPKIHVQPYPKKATQCIKDVLELVHTDIYGPMPTESSKRYFALFVDNY